MASQGKKFKIDHSYEIGVLKSGHTPDRHAAEFQHGIKECAGARS